MKNTFVKVLSLLMALMMAVGVFSTISFAAECTHANATPGDTVAPKCNAVGYTWYTCNDCGVSFKADYKPITGEHNLVSFYPEGAGAAPTCTMPAYNAGAKCADCGTTVTAPTPKEGAENAAKKHSFATGTITTKVYCDDGIYVVYNCVGCGKASHDLAAADSDEVFAPEGGYPPKVEVQAPGSHNWNPYVVKVAPADSCDPATVERTCKACPKVETVVTAHSHDYQEVDHRNKENFCGEFIYFKQCSKCGDVIDAIANPGNGTDHALEKLTAVPAQTSEYYLAYLQFNAANDNKFISGNLSQTANCKQAGWQVYQCSICHQFSVTYWGKQDHKYTGTLDVIGGDNTDNKDKVCVNERAIVRYCEFGCGKYEVVQVLAAAVAHNYTVDVNPKDGQPDGIVVTPATCTTNGFTTYTCQNPGCDVTYDADYTPALGHAMSDYYYCKSEAEKGTEVDANALKCTDGIYRVKKCTREGCVHFEDFETLLAPAEDHVESTTKTKDVAATCHAGAYKYYACANSDLCTIAGDRIESTVGTTFNPANHDLSDATVLAAKRVPATCTTPQYDTFACKCGVDVTVATAPALNHNFGTPAAPNRYWNGPDGKTGTDTEKKDDVDLSEKPATCQSTGLTAGIICANCGLVQLAQTVTPINPNNHAKAGTVLNTVPATCLRPAYQVVRYDACCDARVEVNDPAGTLGGHQNESFGNVAPTCTTTGTHAHDKCKVCGKISNAFTTGDEGNYDAAICGKYHTEQQHLALKESAVWTEADVIIPALGHTYTTFVPREEATCDVISWENKGTDVAPVWVAQTVSGIYGHTAYYICGACGAESEHSILRPHTRDEADFEAKAETCTTFGINAGKYCKICVNIQGSDDFDKAYRAPLGHAYGTDVEDEDLFVFVNVSGDAYTVEKDPTTGAITKITINKVADCKAAAYVLRKCTRCPEMNMVPGSFVAAKADHAWTFAPVSHPVQTERGTGLDTSNYWTYACWGSSYTSKDCTLCDQKSEPVYANDQVQHYYTVAGVKTPIDTDCDAIGKFDAVHCELCGLEVIAGQKAVTTGYAATGYIGANHNFVKNEVKATCDVTGYVTTYCTVCKAEDGAMQTTPAFNPTFNPFVFVDGQQTANLDYSRIVKALIEQKPATVGAEGYVKYLCKLCGQTHTFALPAISALAVTATVSSTKVAAGETFTVTYALSGVEYTFAALDLQATIPANMTLTGIKSEYEGLVAVVAPTGATGGITLVVPNDANGNAQKVTTSVEGTALFTLTYTVNKTATTAADQIITITDVTAVQNHVTVAAATSDKIAVTAVGNLNGDGLVSAEDAQAIFAKVGTNDVASDVNLDGIVNLADVIALAKFAASAKTAADYLEMVGELDTLEAEVFALLESGKLNDVNNDKIVNITDAYALIARVNTAIATGYTNLGNKVTMEAVVAYLNVNASLVIA